MNSILLLSLRYVVALSTLVAGIYALVLARASNLFEQDTAVSVAAAVHLQPRNSEYLDRLAGWQPDNRKTLLERSIAEDPFNYNAWIRLGFISEMQEGDGAEAEKCYLQAANVNHMFLPRWTLANFYFRQQMNDQFFYWTKETLAITPYASDPVFAQMWQMTQNQNTLNAAIPDLPRILLQYAWFLATSKRYDSIPRAVHRLVRLVNKNDAPKWGRDDLLAVSLDRILAAGNVKPALDVWSIMQNAGWIAPAAPSAESPLTNASFRLPTYRHGFDWVFFDNPGTRVEPVPDLAQLRINFYGDEAENVVLFQQYVPVSPATHYHMTWQVQSADLVAPLGVDWHLHAVGGSDGPEVVSGDLMGPNPSWDFVSPADARSFFLTLEYRRPLGTTRARGALTLHSLAMQKE